MGTWETIGAIAGLALAVFIDIKTHIFRNFIKLIMEFF